MIDSKNLTSQLQQWSCEDIYFSGNEYFDDIISNIQQAKQSVYIECYIFNQDKLGNRIISALTDAARNGLEVKLIIDGYGSLNWDAQQLSRLTDTGVQVKIFHPLPWKVSLYKNTIIRKDFFEKFIYLISRINKRNHRKLYIIDEGTAWSGSMNISADHLKQPTEQKPWFDCGIKIRGIAMTEIIDNFNEVWNQKSRIKFEISHLPFRVNNNIIRRQNKNNEFISLIESCSRKVWIISAYLAPSRRVVNALKTAKLNGADVKLIISHHSDVIFFPLISTTYYAELINAGIEVYENNQYIIHAKTILLDELAFVGSSNLNHRSFLHDLEIDIIATQPASLSLLNEKFRQLVENSDNISLSKLESLPWIHHLLGKLIWNIRYWL